VQALRIDHPDGLYDPRAYFHRLQEACGRPMYVAVEKIVGAFENVPEDWAVHGTTGYRFANVVNGLFVDPAAEARITRAYQQFVGDESSVRGGGAALAPLRAAHRARERAHHAHQPARAHLARRPQHARLHLHDAARRARRRCLRPSPVYRTYIDENVRSEDRHYIEWAIAKARQESRAADVGVFDFIRDALTGELPARSPAVAAAVRHFARKFQQVSAPVMAKGFEDTALYNYNRLVSLNDVGGDPAEFGFPPARFHKASSHRARRWPHTMLATSTHDNKRSRTCARASTCSRRWRRAGGCSSASGRA
jgi:(1->4)-alpha-D-glucan 1-alpha-D-glucosylmutase